MKVTHFVFIIIGITLGACSNEMSTDGHDHGTSKATSGTPANVIAIPPSVRKNLGITFARVERRSVQQTLRIPGEFELQPEAIREYRAMAPGRVTLHVHQFQQVSPDDLLFTIDSPLWRELQHEAVEAYGDIPVADAALRVATALKVETEQSAALLDSRIRTLKEVQVRKVDLETQLADLRNKLPRLDAEIASKRVELDEAQEHYQSRLNTLASISGMPLRFLEQQDEDDLPRWRTMSALEVRSDIEGVVDSIEVTNGGWLETGGLALTLVNPNMIRFRANALQSDVSRIRKAHEAAIVPPLSRKGEIHQSIHAELLIGYKASPTQRTVPLYAKPKTPSEWARPGVAGFLEVVTDGDAQAQLAVPASAVVRDGLTSLLFRRDPRNPNQAIRIEADLGDSDGRWIVISSGVREGDEIVLDGVHQLMLAMSGTELKGGHFHADGTFHEEH